MKRILLTLLMITFLIPQEPCVGTCLSEEETINLFNNIKELEFEVDKNKEIIENLNTHGGSLRYYIKKVSNNKFKIYKNVKIQLNRELRYGINKYSKYIEFKNKVESSKRKLKQILLKLKEKNKKIIGYGATAKSSTVLNFCNIKNETLDYFLDTTPGKIGKYMPGTHIYIEAYSKFLLNKADYVFLGAWNLKEEIFKKERRYIKNGGKFITHIPFPRIV